MEVLYYIMAFFAVLGGIDYILGNRFGIGREFQRGMMHLGVMMLSMVGMITLTPLIELALSPLASVMTGIIDPSLLPALFLANDMGGAHLAIELANDPTMGQFNAFVVSSMMGVTVSFTVPYALGVVPKERQPDMLFGLLCGLVTVPIGCFVGGLIMGINVGVLFINILPLIVISGIIGFGVVKFPDACVRIFGGFGVFIKVVVIVGLIAAIAEKLTGIKFIPYTNELSVGTDIIINACCVLAGTFPLVNIISRLLKKPLLSIGRRLEINETSMVGIVATLATNSTTFAIMGDMDAKGAKINSAFAVSAAFVFGSHLGFTLAFLREVENPHPAIIPAVIVGKLVAGIFALALAFALTAKKRGGGTCENTGSEKATASEGSPDADTAEESEGETAPLSAKVTADACES